ncbi:MAG: BrnT family toxin [Chroococcidiopsidaceae cyanobacterium CP_BM_ER_R8_30]|nr:BrnT family toxin [Chroococcidiopsidaceae cyanobacterium CP_BM_ER_R8_30]
MTREEIEALFQRPVWVAPDVKHSSTEERFLAVGRGANRRPMFVVFTLRQEGEELLLRPISARYMHEKEVKRYAEAFTEDE